MSTARRREGGSNSMVDGKWTSNSNSNSSSNSSRNGNSNSDGNSNSSDNVFHHALSPDTDADDDLVAATAATAVESGASPFATIDDYLNARYPVSEEERLRHELGPLHHRYQHQHQHQHQHQEGEEERDELAHPYSAHYGLQYDRHELRDQPPASFATFANGLAGLSSASQHSTDDDRPRGDPPSQRQSLLTIAGVYMAAMLTFFLVVQLTPSLTHPVLVAFLGQFAATGVIFCFSVLYDNSSMYDPYWSVGPLATVLYWALSDFAKWKQLSLRPFLLFAASPSHPHQHQHQHQQRHPDDLLDTPSLYRQCIVLAVVLVWSVRLTYNCLVRWGGLHDEDWRYRDLRDQFPSFLYWMASLVGVHYIPTALVTIGCLALFPALVVGSSPLNALDALAALVCLVAVYIEATADAQLRRFIRKGKSKPGDVLCSGLWAYSRHPNYFGEVLFWWGVWIFAVSSTWSSGQPLPVYTLFGPLCITLLFLYVSVPLVEDRMLKRRAKFAAYKSRTSALVPWFPRKEAVH